MIYTFTLIDKPEMAALRQRVRPACRSACFAPLTHDDGVAMIGSLLAIDFPSRDAAHAWLANEPFTKSGLYASTSIQAFVNLWPQKAGFPPAA